MPGGSTIVSTPPRMRAGGLIVEEKGASVAPPALAAWPEALRWAA
jgi:hypothetical protein